MNQVLCSECGAETGHESLNGLCPRCLFLLAAEVQATSDDARGFRPKNAERIRYLGDYEILNEVARGGMGAVYRARQVSLNRIVALKLMLSGEYASRTERERFQNEAEGAAKLQHPNIVSIHEIGSAHGQPYFSMDFVEGENLAEVIRREPPSTIQAAEWVRTLAQAVEYAHRKGILHRDLKPQNILVENDGRLRITDFGLSKRIDSASELTATGAVLGTPGYMAPEQAAGSLELIGPATDVYGLGAILYEMLTGRPPFREATAAKTIVKVTEEEVARPSKLVPTVPADLETIALKCLEKSPGKRYPTAHHLAEELGRFVRGEPILAVPATALRRTASWCLRHPWVLTGGASCLLLTLLGVLFGLWEHNRYLVWKASGAARPVSRDYVISTFMVLMGLGFFLSLGLYAIAARRRSRGERLNTAQLAVMGSLGGYQTLVTLASALGITSKAAWGELKDLPYPFFLLLHFVYLWPGLLLCWDAAAGGISARRAPGLSVKSASPEGPRLRINFGVGMAVFFGLTLVATAYARIMIPPLGFDLGYTFDHPAEMTVAVVNKWWAVHYEYLNNVALEFRRAFLMVAMFCAGLIPAVSVIWKDPRGHWRKILPLFLVLNGMMVLMLTVIASPFAKLPWPLLAQAILLGLAASIVLWRVARIRVSSEPRPYSLEAMLPPARAATKWAVLALAMNALILWAAGARGLLDLLPLAIITSVASVGAGTILPFWRRFTADDKLGVVTALLIAAYGTPATLAGIPAGAVIYALNKRRTDRAAV